jgi:hypothetical protein
MLKLTFKRLLCSWGWLAHHPQTPRASQGEPVRPEPHSVRYSGGMCLSTHAELYQGQKLNSKSFLIFLKKDLSKKRTPYRWGAGVFHRYRLRCHWERAQDDSSAICATTSQLIICARARDAHTRITITKF